MPATSFARISAALLHAALASCHQPIEVRATDQRGSCAERHRGHHVAAGQDAAVDVDLGPVTDRVDHPGQLLQRGRRAVQLATAVVRDDHVRPPRRRPPLARPRRSVMPLTTSGPVQISRSQARSRIVRAGSNTWPTSSATVPSKRFSDANSSISVVSRSNHHRACRAPSAKVLSRQRGRQGQTVAHVAQPGTGHRCVDGEHERLVPRRLRPNDEVAAGGPVAPEVELEPPSGSWDLGREPLDRRRAHRRQGNGDAGSLGGPGHGPFALRVHHPGEAGGGEDQRQPAGAPRIVVVVSMLDTSRRTRGWNSIRAKAARDLRRLISSPAPPSA